MVVEQAGNERADYEITGLERLVDGRRLVDAPGDGLEIFDVKDPGLQVAVPADDVERVVVQHVTANPVAHLHADLELTPFRMRLQL
jgi:hypothetical protein